jgi:hypothetical protein
MNPTFMGHSFSALDRFRSASSRPVAGRKWWSTERARRCRLLGTCRYFGKRFSLIRDALASGESPVASGQVLMGSDSVSEAKHRDRMD